jgi:diketogulonate reductase-like aldo/keto reductase
VLDALEVGYRAIDTAFIYGGEKTEALVGQAIQQAIAKGIIQSRKEVFITTKHWRKYHGYEPTLQCLNLSLRRLAVDVIDLYLMHWAGPAWSTMNREKKYVEQDPWHYATTCESDMAAMRAETWRAMEDALRQGKVRSIGVSNFTVQHLQTLQKSATIWPPAVNQVEFQ